MAIILPKLVAENIDRFTGRSWVVSKFLDWWDRTDERLFLLTGGPGTGKSMISGWLANSGPPPKDAAAATQLTRLRSLVKAAHFCQATSLNITPQAFSESVASQLAATVNGFSEAIVRTLGDRVQIVTAQSVETVAPGGSATNLSIGRIELDTPSDELSFDQAFTQPLKKLYAGGYNEPMLLLVDALDEAQTYTGVTLPDLLSRLADLPVGVRIFATTRDDPRILKLFRNATVFDLIRDADPNVDDVRAYAEQRLRGLTMLDECKRKDFAQRLSKQALGVFLYASVVLDEITGRPLAGFPDLATYPLPEGLSGLYHEFITRELGRDEQRWFDLFEPLLGLIAVAQGDGLTSQQLTSIIGKDIRAAIRICKQYLSGDLPEGPFRFFHKSFVDFLLEDESNLDYHIGAPGMHRRIVEYYWLKHQLDWRNCDDYGLANMARHIFQSGQFSKFEELIGQAWMHARVTRDFSGYRGFVADLMLAWQGVYQIALRQIDADESEFKAFATCFRYGLVHTCINTLSSNYPPALVKRAIESDIWSFSRALEIAAHVQDPVARAEMYLTVLQTLKNGFSEAQHREARDGALSAARTIPDAVDRVEWLAAIGSHFSTQERVSVLEEAMATARTVQASGARSFALVALAMHLRGEQIQEAVTLARETENKAFRAMALARIGSRLDGEEKTSALTEALSVARAVTDNNLRYRALAVTAGHVGKQKKAVLGEAIAAARAVDDEYRVEALAELAPQLSGKARTRLLGEALSETLALTDEWHLARALAELVPQLSGVQLKEAVESAWAIKCTECRCYALTAAASQLSNEQVRKALTLARTIWSEKSRASLLTALAPRLTGRLKENVIEQALVSASAIESAKDRAKALTALAPQLLPKHLRVALVPTLGIESQRLFAQVLTALALGLKGEAKIEVLDEAFAAAAAIRHEQYRVEAIIELAPLIPQLGEEAKATVKEALLAAWMKAPTIENQGERARVLGALAPFLGRKKLGKALEAARAIDDEGDRALLLSRLAVQLSGSVKNNVMQEALAAALAIKSDVTRALTLGALAHNLNAAQLKQTLTAARSIDRSFRLWALEALAPKLRGKAKASVVGKVLAAADTEETESWRASVLSRLAPHLGRVQLIKALATARAMRSNDSRAKALTALARRLKGKAKGDAVDDALTAARAIKDDLLRAHALLQLRFASDRGVLMKELRVCLVDYLGSQLMYGSGTELVGTIFRVVKLALPIFGERTAIVMARNVNEIFRQWSWL